MMVTNLTNKKMNCITKSLALAVTSTVFVSCNKEPEATVKTHYGIDAPISQAQQINGVWVFNENAQKYQDEMESKYKKEFRDYVEIAYSSWCYKQELARPKENLGRLTNTEIATKYPM